MCCRRIAMVGAERLLFALLLLFLVFFGVSQPIKFWFLHFGQNNSDDLVYMGNASFSPSQAHIDLTPDSNQTSDFKNCIGRVLYRQPVQIWPASFTTTFTIAVKNISHDENLIADGMAFIIVPNNKSVLPDRYGGFLGLFDFSTKENTTQQLAIEFDTFKNVIDPDNNHVGIDTKSIESDATANLGIHGMDLKSGRPIRVRVDYDGWAKFLQIFVAYADNATATYTSLLNYTIELSQTVPRLAYVGFSASTGNSYATYRVLDWNFSLVTLPESSLDLSKTGSGFGVKVGVPLAVAIALAMALALWVFVRRRNARKTRPTLSLSAGFSQELAIYESVPHKFTYKQLSVATNNFSEAELLGAGGFGSVYRGNLGVEKEGPYVAVKRISAGSRQGEREFISEIATIGRLRHRNLVQLQGWCHDHDELLLVYDYMPNGSLDKILFGSGENLNWQRRHRILCGLASALLYLHEEWEQRVVHRDVKPSNVMLDGEFNARLGDFGLARFIEHNDSSPAVSTRLAGTPGYMAPECGYTGKATAESDVFSFGIVVLEVTTGRRVVERKPPLADGKLLDWVWGLYGEGKVEECADPRLEFDGELLDEEERKEIKRVLVLGLACSYPDPLLRPSARQALQVLINPSEKMPTLPPTRPMAIYVAVPELGSVHSESTVSFSKRGKGGGASTSASGETRMASIAISTLDYGR